MRMELRPAILKVMEEQPNRAYIKEEAFDRYGKRLEGEYFAVHRCREDTEVDMGNFWNRFNEVSLEMGLRTPVK
jgi:hypothetical protein